MEVIAPYLRDQGDNIVVPPKEVFWSRIPRIVFAIIYVVVSMDVAQGID